MTTLRIVVDDVLGANGRSAARFATELTRALIAGSPRGCVVEGVCAAIAPADRARIDELLPGLSALHVGRLSAARRAAAWRAGLRAGVPRGLLHSPSLAAPLRQHDRHGPRSEQVTVTVADSAAWRAPESLAPRAVAWRLAMLDRAARYADAVAVPSHAVAADLVERVDLGDRIRVVAPAVAPSLRVPDDADVVAERLALPERYVLTTADLDPRRGLDALLEAMRELDAPLVVAGDPGWRDRTLSEALERHRLEPGRVVLLGPRDDAELAVAYSRASVFANPALETGFGLSSLESFSLGTPVVNSDAPALEEMAGGAGLVVERGDDFAANLAEALGAVLDDDRLAERLRIKGRDRARLFGWRDSAEKIWQLHADL